MGTSWRGFVKIIIKRLTKIGSLIFLGMEFKGGSISVENTSKLAEKLLLIYNEK